MSAIVNQKLADRAAQIARTQRIDFGEALCQARREQAPAAQVPFTPTAVLSIDHFSVGLTRWAEKVAKEDGISFCEALPIARQEISMASNIIDPAQIGQTVDTVLSDYFVKVLQGSQEKMISNNEIYQAMAAVTSALNTLGIDGSLADAIKSEVEKSLRGLVNDSGEGIVHADGVAAIIKQTASHAQQIYLQNLDQLRGDSAAASSTALKKLNEATDVMKQARRNGII